MLAIILVLIGLLWVRIRYDPKIDWIRKGGESFHLILWYNKYNCYGEAERKYIILLQC